METWTQEDSWAAVLAERRAQDAKWGPDRNLHPLMWLAILVEEVGEFSQAFIDEQPMQVWRDECVQVAASALAMVECFDRNDEGYHNSLCAGREHVPPGSANLRPT